MKATPDIPPVLREFVAEIVEASDEASVIPTPADSAGDWSIECIMRARAERLRDIATRLQTIAATLEAGWKPSVAPDARSAPTVTARGHYSEGLAIIEHTSAPATEYSETIALSVCLSDEDCRKFEALLWRLHEAKRRADTAEAATVEAIAAWLERDRRASDLAMFLRRGDWKKR